MQDLAVFAEPARAAGRREHDEIVVLDEFAAGPLDLFLQEADGVAHHALERVADLGRDVLAGDLVAARRIRRQDPAVDAEVPQARGADVAGVAHVGDQPDALLVRVAGVDPELVEVQADGPALADDALVGLRPRDERRVVRLGVRHQDQQRLAHRLLDQLFLVDLQTVRPAGEVDHADREQVRMLGDEDVGLQDPDALVPELVLTNSSSGMSWNRCSRNCCGM